MSVMKINSLATGCRGPRNEPGSNDSRSRPKLDVVTENTAVRGSDW
jgi:hypothetical protein